MSKEKIEIKRMVIEMGGKEVELSIEDARKLLAALKDVFNEPAEKEYVPYPQPHYVPYYTRPWYEPRPYWWGSTFTVGDLPLYKSTAGSVMHNKDAPLMKLALTASNPIEIR